MKVFRIERVNGGGVYRTTAGSEAQKKTSDSYKTHPVPSNDPGLMDWYNSRYIGDAPGVSDYYFGFKDMEQLEEWWPTENHHVFRTYNANCETEEDRLNLVVYEVDHSFVQIGETQVMFLRGEATHKDVLDHFNAEIITVMA